MLKIVHAFSGFSVADLDKAQKFYADTLGLKVSKQPEGLEVEAPGAAPVFIYPSESNKPAMYTVFNFVVEDIDAAVENLSGKGVSMEHYDLPQMKTDAKGVLRSVGSEPGPKAIAWFKDPHGNILSVIQEK